MLPIVIKKKAEKALKDLCAHIETAQHKFQDDAPALDPEEFVSVANNVGVPAGAQRRWLERDHVHHLCGLGILVFFAILLALGGNDFSFSSAISASCEKGCQWVQALALAA